MATYIQLKYCPKCKKTVSADKDEKCKVCGSKVSRGKWIVQFWINNFYGKKQKKLSGFATKREAQQAYIDFVSENKKDSKPEKLKFDLLYEEYRDFSKKRLKESSFYDFNSKCNIHILPYFKNFLVQEITPKKLLEWQDSLSEYSYKYKRNIRSYLMAILKYAEKYYGIPNQLKNTDNFRNTSPKKEMQVWSPDEFNAFIQYVDKIEYKAFFYALYYTGARKGEILATTWEDWDLEKGYLNITKSLSKKVYGASWLVTTPKNQSSVRKVSLPPNLIEIMKDFKNKSFDGHFVFYGEKPLADVNMGRIRDEACKKAGVKIIRLHDFRHSHASLLLSQGVSVVAVAKRLGHSNIEQTLNTYAHLMPQEDLALLNVLKNCDKK